MEGRDLSADAAFIERSVTAGAQPLDGPYLIMLSGLPGTGKSFLAQKLQERLPAAVVESDAVRAILFQPVSFSAGESEWVFDVCHATIERLLRRGIGTIMDATNLQERHRERVYDIAEQCDASLFIVRVDAPPRVVRERLEQRLAMAGPQGPYAADWEVYRRMRYTKERIGRDHFYVDTSKGTEEAVVSVVDAVQNRLQE